jgi:tRNA-modifying protein YgfZ
MTIGAEAFSRWQPAAWLRVAGPEAFVFLQGQFTNDLRDLEKSSAVYGLWLNQKGRVLADSFVVRGHAAEEFWVGSYFSSAAVIRERLESYIIADDVTIADETTGWSGVTLTGPNAAAAARGLGSGFVFAGRRGLADAVEYIAPGIPEIKDRAQLSAEEMERARIQALIPAVPRDLGAGELPNEGALENVAISYTKGCYLGQEVIARLKSMGKVRRQLFLVKGTGLAPTGPAKLYQGQKPVGELRSTVPAGDGFIGLALCGLLHLRRDAGLSFAPDAPAVVTLVDPP